MLPEEFKRKTQELRDRLQQEKTVMYSNIRIKKIYEGKNKNQEEN